MPSAAELVDCICLALCYLLLSLSLSHFYLLLLVLRICSVVDTSMDLHLTELNAGKARRMEKRRKISEYNTNLDLTKSVNFPVVVAAVEHEVGCIEAGIIRSRAVVGLPWVPRRGEHVHCLVVDCPDPAKKEGRGLIR